MSKLKYSIHTNTRGDYEVTSEDSGVAAIIDNKTKEVKYYVTGCYNSSWDWLSINIKELDELRELCKAIVEHRYTLTIEGRGD
jgi:hypothetical protein